MDARTLSRAEQVSSRQSAFLRSLFIPLTIFMLLIIVYWLTGGSHFKIYKPLPFYPHWKKKPPETCGVAVQNDPIVKVNNLKIYMVGSYVEHRQEKKLLRTISIMLRSESAEIAYCLLCCNGRILSAPVTYDIHSDHFGFDYGTTDITCQLPKTCPEPTHVAISSKSPEEDGFSQDTHIFQPVRNEKEEETFPYNFTVCISVMYDYDNILEFVQAMEIFKILGVQKVAIYKTSCDSTMQKILDYYVKQEFVELIPWKIASYISVSKSWKKSVSSGELHYYGQIPALNDCVYRYMYQSRYVALQDLDEIILPMKSESWLELLPELEKKYDQMGGFEFENNFFPLSFTDSDSKYSPPSWKKVKGVNILEHITRISNDPSLFNNFKVIVNPRLVYKSTVHGILEHVKGTVRVDPQVARMYHMRDIPNDIVVQRYKIQDAHLRDYADRLIPAVSKVLQKTLGI